MIIFGDFKDDWEVYIIILIMAIMDFYTLIINYHGFLWMSIRSSQNDTNI